MFINHKNILLFRYSRQMNLTSYHLKIKKLWKCIEAKLRCKNFTRIDWQAIKEAQITIGTNPIAGETKKINAQHSDALHLHQTKCINKVSQDQSISS